MFRASVTCFCLFFLTVAFKSFGQATSNSPLCEGGTLQLNCPTSTSTYEWTGPDGFISDIRNPSIAGVTLAKGGVYQVTIYQGATPTTFTVNVIINPTPELPDVDNAYNGCAGSRFSIVPRNLVPSYNYRWNGPFTSTQDSLVIGSLATSHQGSYSVYAILGQCTSAVKNFQVTVFSKPATPVISTPAQICASEDIMLNTSNGSGLQHYWSGPQSFNSTAISPVISNATQQMTGTYSVVFNNGVCSGDTAKKNITILPIPKTPTITGDIKLCIGDTLNLTAQTTGNVSLFDWQAPPGPGSTRSYIKNGVVKADEGLYIVRYSDGNCFSKDTSVFVLIFTPPVKPTIRTMRDTLCEGDSLLMYTYQDETFSYRWSGPNNFSHPSPEFTKQNVTQADSGYYSLYIIQNGCPSETDSHFVSIKSTPVSPGLNTNAPVCEETQLLVQTNSIDPTVTYSWYHPYDGSLVSDSIINDSSAALEDAGYYLFTASRSGCVSKPDSIYVRIKRRIKDFFPYINKPVCTYYDLILKMADYEEAEYRWTGPNGFVDYNQNAGKIGVQYADSGYYTATAQNTCNRRDTTIFVPVLGSPTPEITGDSAICDNDTVILGLEKEYSTYEWRLAGSNTVLDTTPELMILKKGEYWVKVSNEVGCYTTTSLKVEYRCEPVLYIPSAFTPDGDNINDVFYVRGHNISQFRLEVFARNGNLVYTSENLDEGWDGRYKGSLLQPGMYYYEIKYKAYYDYAIYEERIAGTFAMLR